MRLSDHSIESGFWRQLGLLAALVFLAAGPATTVQAKLVKDGAKAQGPGPDAVFTAIAEAWQQEDEEALAALVHQDGLRVTAGDYDRFTNYSPSQAYYYFKNQFQQHPTVSFQFERLQERLSGQDRVHGMVVWEYRKAHQSGTREIRLVLVLTRQEGGWRLAEINAITSR